MDLKILHLTCKSYHAVSITSLKKITTDAANITEIISDDDHELGNIYKTRIYSNKDFCEMLRNALLETAEEYVLLWLDDFIPKKTLSTNQLNKIVIQMKESNVDFLNIHSAPVMKANSKDSFTVFDFYY